MAKRQTRAATKDKKYPGYLIVRKADTGQITLGKVSGKRRDEYVRPSDRASDDLVRFSNVEFSTLTSKPDKKIEEKLRKAVRAAMKKKPLGSL
jgi:hypothetical protein